MLSFRDFLTSFRQLKLGQVSIIAHSSLSAFRSVQGGAETVVGALTAAFSELVVPTFTYRTMIIPEAGPPNNGITYGSGKDSNRMAEFYSPEMPVDRLMGIISETVRQHPKARRSTHPIYSFSGINTNQALKAQTLADPFGPIRVLTEADGWVLLLGVDHAANTSIHYAEMLSGRRQFIRWALTPQGVVECAGWPGCSYGFNAIAPLLEKSVRKTEIGPALVQAIPLQAIVIAVKEMVAKDPFALLCDRSGCERCETNRKLI